MAPAQKLYTLTEVSKETGISMPTLQRYKKRHQDRIPSVGEGRTQRYPRKAFAVFKKIKEENLKKRGRPSASDKKSKKSTKSKRGGGKASSKRRSRKGGGGEQELLTLLEVGRRTGISYPTLLRYVKLHGGKIPHVGSGRRKRYPVEAVEVFQEIRQSSKRGPRPKKPGRGSARRTASGSDREMATRIRELEAAQKKVTQQLDEIIELLKQPMKITVRPD